MTKTDERSDERGAAIFHFRADAELAAEIKATAAAEGISWSDVARRAAIRDLMKSADQAVAR
jgi:hypothetical protein